MGLLMGPDSHYEKKSVNAMNMEDRNIRIEADSIGEIISTARNETGAINKKILPLNPGAAKFYGKPKHTKPPKPICLSQPFSQRWHSYSRVTRPVS